MVQENERGEQVQEGEEDVEVKGHEVSLTRQAWCWIWDWVAGSSKSGLRDVVLMCERLRGLLTQHVGIKKVSSDFSFSMQHTSFLQYFFVFVCYCTDSVLYLLPLSKHKYIIFEKFSISICFFQFFLILHIYLPQNESISSLSSFLGKV